MFLQLQSVLTSTPLILEHMLIQVTKPAISQGTPLYPGAQAETYSLAYDDQSTKIGHLYLDDNNTGNLYYRESTDGTVTWSTPVEVWTYDAVDSMGTLRGCDLVLLNGVPCAVFEIDKD